MKTTVNRAGGSFVPQEGYLWGNATRSTVVLWRSRCFTTAVDRSAHGCCGRDVAGRCVFELRSGVRLAFSYRCFDAFSADGGAWCDSSSCDVLLLTGSSSSPIMSSFARESWCGMQIRSICHEISRENEDIRSLAQNRHDALKQHQS